MREIKFISRHPENSTRLHGEIANRWGFNEHGYFHENGLPDAKYIQCEFTGIKDKKAVEMYEGDIVKWENVITSESGVGVIEYSSLLGRFQIRYEDVGYQLNPYKCDYFIIGNIYSNPELLNTDNNG